MLSSTYTVNLPLHLCISWQKPCNTSSCPFLSWWSKHIYSIFLNYNFINLKTWSVSVKAHFVIAAHYVSKISAHFVTTLKNSCQFIRICDLGCKKLQSLLYLKWAGVTMYSLLESQIVLYNTCWYWFVTIHHCWPN